MTATPRSDAGMLAVSRLAHARAASEASDAAAILNSITPSEAFNHSAQRSASSPAVAVDEL